MYKLLKCECYSYICTNCLNKSKKGDKCPKSLPYENHKKEIINDMLKFLENEIKIRQEKEKQLK